MQRHAEIGHRLLSGSVVGGPRAGGRRSRSTHHERWDGNGYPYGLAGEAIPLEGRIASVADVFDALTTDRVYRQALPVEEALAMMREQRGSQFDPLVFDVLEDIVREKEDETPRRRRHGRRRGSGEKPVPARLRVADRDPSRQEAASQDLGAATAPRLPVPRSAGSREGGDAA